MTVSLARNARMVYVAGHSFSPDETAAARRWYNQTADEPLGRGRISHDILFAWHSDGRPFVAAPLVPVATIFYRSVSPSGRLNRAVRTHIVSAASMPGGKGRPRTADYVTASGLTRETARISRIVTEQGAVHSVTVDQETGEYVYRWESKADQKAVILSLMHALRTANDRLAGAGLETVPTA